MPPTGKWDPIQQLRGRSDRKRRGAFSQRAGPKATALPVFSSVRARVCAWQALPLGSNTTCPDSPASPRAKAPARPSSGLLPGWQHPQQQLVARYDVHDDEGGAHAGHCHAPRSSRVGRVSSRLPGTSSAGAGRSPGSRCRAAAAGPRSRCQSRPWRCPGKPHPDGRRLAT